MDNSAEDAGAVPIVVEDVPVDAVVDSEDRPEPQVAQANSDASDASPEDQPITAQAENQVEEAPRLLDAPTAPATPVQTPERADRTVDNGAGQATREAFVAPVPPAPDLQPPSDARAEARQDPLNVTDHPVTDKVAAAWQSVEPFIISPAHMESNRIVALQEGRAGSEFDMLRTRVLQQMRANNWRRLAITSPTPACGKSTIALNLAFAICRQPKLRTVLLEMDLRRPSLASALGVSMGHKFAHVLAGEEPFSQHALRHGNNLIIATNRSPTKRSAELLQAPEATQALTDIETTYRPDFMIMDMPPMLVSDDTIAFMDQVDCVLLVAAAETTTVKEVDMCERELSQHTNVMGVVLNKCRHMGPEDGYGYYA